MNIIFLNSHPIQYFAPLYREVSAEPDMNLTVLYCSRHGLEGEVDWEFGIKVKWDIPLLEGYHSIFLKNHAPVKSGIYSFAGLLNLGVVSFLRKAPKSVLVVHGWGYLTHLLALLAGRLFGHVVCLRGESPLKHELKRSAGLFNFRQLFLSKMLFRLPHHFLYIGQENKAFYKRFGVQESKFVFAPYAVDNRRFDESYRQILPQRQQLKTMLGLPAGKTVILFSGKYIDKKCPLDLLQAFSRCEGRAGACLVFMGEGELRQAMERFIEEYRLENVYLTGFVNQSKVAEYYTVADVFVMCSKEGETWGLSTNEAMNFCLPLLLSDMTGSSADLVAQGKNGYVFITGNIDDFAEKLDILLAQPPEQLREMGKVSAKIIGRYSYRQILDGLKSLQGNFEKNTQQKIKT